VIANGFAACKLNPTHDCQEQRYLCQTPASPIEERLLIRLAPLPLSLAPPLFSAAAVGAQGW
jgi:hypothetical protein